MKKIALIFIALSVAGICFFSVWQAFTFETLKADVEVLEGRQRELFEQNKRQIIGIEYLSSPRRIDQISRELELEKIDPSRVIRVVLPEGEADGGPQGGEDG
ncbi:MAG: hypothetical protein LBQ61_08710 [Spirochaetales bacterium]|jgi:hypothetical protein|nr:hypothetical protein [Spirochaetales bacterium]